MPFDDVKKFSNAAVAKATLLREHPGKYFIRAVMAGFFIAVAMIYSNVVNSLFADTSAAWGKFLGGLVFSIAVLLIVFIGSELFTGNNLIMAFGAYDRAVSWGQTVKVWIVSYIGNFVGCFLYLPVSGCWPARSGAQDYLAGHDRRKALHRARERCFSGRSSVTSSCAWPWPAAPNARRRPPSS